MTGKIHPPTPFLFLPHPRQALPQYSFYTKVIKAIGKNVLPKIGAASYHNQNIIGTEFIYTTAACFR